MIDVAHLLARSLPQGFREALKGTVIDSSYQAIRYRTTSFKRVEFRTPAGEIALRIPEDDAFDRHADNADGHEPLLVADLNQCLSGSTVFYDIGSHFGYMLRVALQVGVPAASIHAFEANSFRYRVLEEEFGTSGVHVEHSRVGVSDPSGALSIDDYCASHEVPDVVKIDIEGAEFNALRGMEDTIDRCHPRLYVEIHPNRLENFGTSSIEVMDFLRGHGYALDQGERDPSVREWSSPTNSSPHTKPYLVRATRSR